MKIKTLFRIKIILIFISLFACDILDEDPFVQTNAENYYQNCLSLPMYPTLTKMEQDLVILKIKEFIYG